MLWEVVRKYSKSTFAIASDTCFPLRFYLDLKQLIVELEAKKIFSLLRRRKRSHFHLFMLEGKILKIVNKHVKTISFSFDLILEWFSESFYVYIERKNNIFRFFSPISRNSWIKKQFLFLHCSQLSVHSMMLLLLILRFTLNKKSFLLIHNRWFPIGKRYLLQRSWEVYRENFSIIFLIVPCFCSDKRSTSKFRSQNCSRTLSSITKRKLK